MQLSFASLFLRLGCTLVGFMVLFGHLLWLSILPRIDCATSGHELWSALMLMAAPSLFFAALLLASRPITAVTGGLKWLCVPLLLMVPLALIGLWPTLQTTTFGGSPICPDPANSAPAALWETLWGCLLYTSPSPRD